MCWGVGVGVKICIYEFDWEATLHKCAYKACCVCLYIYSTYMYLLNFHIFGGYDFAELKVWHFFKKWIDIKTVLKDFRIISWRLSFVKSRWNINA